MEEASPAVSTAARIGSDRLGSDALGPQGHWRTREGAREYPLRDRQIGQPAKLVGPVLALARLSGYSAAKECAEALSKALVPTRQALSLLRDSPPVAAYFKGCVQINEFLLTDGQGRIVIPTQVPKELLINKIF